MGFHKNTLLYGSTEEVHTTEQRVVGERRLPCVALNCNDTATHYVKFFGEWETVCEEHR
jgi:hypothetical protein